jgi:hypothetical protein
LTETKDNLSPKASTRGSLSAWFALVTTVVLVFVVSALISLQTDKLPFDTVPGELLIERQPDYVFIGNSMLDTRINPVHLESMTGNDKVEVLTSPGGLSAFWYLTLKNQVVQSDLNPRAVFIFFRVDELTSPLDRISGKYLDRVEKLSGESEPEFDLIIGKNQSLIDKFEGSIASVVTIDSKYSYRRQKILVSELIERFAAAPLIPWLLPGSVLHSLGAIDSGNYLTLMSEYQHLKLDANSVFERVNFRPVDQPSVIPKVERPFSELVADSFLPEILQLGVENDIPLVFVRIQLRPWEDGRMQTTDYVEDYIVDLKNYVSERGASVLDMHGNPDIRSELYIDGDHIDTKHRDTYTELFFKEAAEYFE